MQVVKGREREREEQLSLSPSPSPSPLTPPPPSPSPRAFDDGAEGLGSRELKVCLRGFYLGFRAWLKRCRFEFCVSKFGKNGTVLKQRHGFDMIRKKNKTGQHSNLSI